jgi:Mg2+-importing ATPase
MQQCGVTVRPAPPVDQLVPGDVMGLTGGDLVPADARLLDSRDPFVNQALLTTEPYPAETQASDALRPP